MILMAEFVFLAVQKMLLTCSYTPLTAWWNAVKVWLITVHAGSSMLQSGASTHPGVY